MASEALSNNHSNKIKDMREKIEKEMIDCYMKRCRQPKDQFHHCPLLFVVVPNFIASPNWTISFRKRQVFTENTRSC